MQAEAGRYTKEVAATRRWIQEARELLGKLKCGGRSPILVGMHPKVRRPYRFGYVQSLFDDECDP
jgi:hypothetical protein